MTREIKFRLRIKHRRGDHPDMTMVVPLMGVQNGLIETPFNNGDWEVLYADQYTGLKDKNGREIYEGDIVKVHYSDPIKGVVEFDTEGGEYRINPYHLSCENMREVIGNIHENPELLESP